MQVGQRSPGRAFPALFLLLVPMLPGCITGAMWSQASESSIYTTRIYGVLAGKDGAPSQLVVDAHMNATPVFFVLPLDADGRPAAPFRYDGEAHSLLAIAAETGCPHGPEADPSPAARVHNATLDRAAGRPTRSPSYRPLDIEACCDPRHSGVPTWESDNGVIVVAFRLGADGQLTPAPGHRTGGLTGADGRPLPSSATRPILPGPADVVWPDDCLFVVLPDRQPRPQRDVAASQAGAALLTPVTVCVDVAIGVGLSIVIVPVLIAMLATGYHDC